MGVQEAFSYGCTGGGVLIWLYRSRFNMGVQQAHTHGCNGAGALIWVYISLLYSHTSPLDLYPAHIPSSRSIHNILFCL